MSREQVKWSSEAIECVNCGKKAEVQAAESELCRHWRQLPEGWFCDQGLGDTAQVACSFKCIEVIAKKET